MPTKAHLAAAEQLKCDGNALFARGKYGAAVEVSQGINGYKA